jgi:ubiquinone/menaquinone biosynthesis C-methylase UbiE
MENTSYIPALRFRWLTRFYDPVVRASMRENEFKTALLRQAALEPGQNVLDFGCGTLTLSLLAKQLQPQLHIRGVDVDMEIVEMARQKSARQGADVPVDGYDGSVLPYEDHTFDRVISSLVFHHLRSPQKRQALVEIYRVLKPGGQLHIADFGKPQNYYTWLAFNLVRGLDGWENTQANGEGLLPVIIRRNGFSNVSETEYFNTVFGTVRLIKAIKS